MNMGYRAYLCTDDEHIVMMPTQYYTGVLRREQAMAKFLNQHVQLIEAQVISENQSESLHGIKIWNLLTDERGFVKERSFKRYSSAEIAQIEKTELMNNSHLQLQSYIDDLFDTEPQKSAATSQAETITSRVWKVFRVVSEMQKAA